MRQQLNLKRLIGTAFAIYGIWFIFSLFSTSEFYRRVIEARESVDGVLPDVLTIQLFSGMLWAFFTPFVIAIAERLPVCRPHAARNVAALLAITPVLAAIRASWGGAVLQYFSSEPITWDFARLSVTIRFQRWWMFVAVIVILTNVYMALRESMNRERRSMSAQAEAAAVELAALRARVQPRFILSTIDTIKARIDDDPDAADRAIVALSDVLRRTLEHGRHSDVTLADELELVDRYLALEKTRSGAAVDTRFTVDDDLLSARVPPLLLQTVLNGAMFGRAGASDRLLAIRGSATEERLTIEMQYEPSLPKTEEATEEAHVRLRRIYGEEFGMRTLGDDVSTVISIDLPLRYGSAA
jgi:two-component system, LytTR family, sensor kinase